MREYVVGWMDGYVGGRTDGVDVWMDGCVGGLDICVGGFGYAMGVLGELS